MKRLVEEFFDDSSSEEEEEDDDFEMAMALITREEEAKRRRGSQLGRRRIYRNRAEGHVKLVRDYFADDPVYPENLFRRRFRMHRDLFVRIVRAVEAHDIWFTMRRNAVGEISASPLQKCTAAMRVLAYGVSSDFVDEYIRIGEDLILESVKRFTQAVIEIFGEEYLRAPTDEDTARLMAMGEARGFPGMLGSIDCMHWTWKNCPAAWHGQFRGHCHDPTIILEAVASEDLWFWHSYFGMPGSHNDLNVLQRSPLFARLAAGQAPPCNYVVNGHQYNMGYYLADGIYPHGPHL